MRAVGATAMVDEPSLGGSTGVVGLATVVEMSVVVAVLVFLGTVVGVTRCFVETTVADVGATTAGVVVGVFESDVELYQTKQMMISC